MKLFKKFLIPTIALFFVFAIGIIGLRQVRAATVINLGTADSFAVLAGSAISETNPSTITGDVGLSPAAGSFITGLLSTEVTGTIYAVDASGPAGSVSNPSLLTAAKNALTAAYNSAVASSPAVTLANPELGGQTFTSGTYYSAAPIYITGTTTLDAQGDINAVFIFQADATTLTTLSASHVNLINGAQACNVFWQVGSSATFGTGSDFKGNVLAFSSITDSGGSTILGRLLARNAAVTLNNTHLTKATCSAPPATGTITVTKVVNNNYGGTKVVSNFPLFIDGNSIVSGVATTTLAGLHTISETGSTGYTAIISGDCAADGTINIASGATVACTITNSDIAPQLTVTKTVNNNHGGTKVVANFPLYIDGQVVVSGVASTTTAGLHTISETTDPGYTSVIGGDCSSTGTINLALGSVKFCTIINSDIDPATSTITITKIVNNNHGGTKVVANFPLFIDGYSVTSSVATTTLAGFHTISETSDPGYTSVIGGDCSSTGTINIAPGGTAACTITNSDIAPQLTVTKFVVGGSKVIADLPLFIDGHSVTSGIASTTISGLHTISETSDSNYSSIIGGDCSSTGTINLALGDIKLCTITNTYVTPPSSGGGSSYVPPVPPIIDVVKVPSPLALPNGPGPVEYTYTLRNIGKVPVVNITMVDDSCSSTSFVSGDTNKDSKLDLKETWIYKCSTTLSKTHTNIVVATGWANGLSATDIANATVVVGAPIIPPLIHVTKLPNPLILNSKGGMVTYTERISNPGLIALSNVRLTDDKCSPVVYISGDTNVDSKLDTSETWTYVCRTNIKQTTINTATASGEANGLVARDFAFATVVVAPGAVQIVPGLPNTGIYQEEKNLFWHVVISVGIIAFISVSLTVVCRKKAY